MAHLGPVLIQVAALSLILAGLTAITLGILSRFLPHDEQFLGMTAGRLCALDGCRIVHFMIHDRISFGGAVVAVGLLYSWLAAGPLRRSQSWAWWTLLLSAAVGFASFLTYIGYGYLDTWHGLATVGLLVPFVLGLWSSARFLQLQGSASVARSGRAWPSDLRARLGRWCLLAAAAGLILGGLTILTVGMTCVFVPQDLAFMQVDVAHLHDINPRLVPLIAHDRAGFGGAVCSCGVALLLCVWFAEPSRRLWWVLALVGAVGFGTAIGVHPAIGYVDPVHLAPALVGATVYAVGLALTFAAMANGRQSASEDGP